MNFIRLLSVVFSYIYHEKDDKIENKAMKTLFLFNILKALKKH